MKKITFLLFVLFIALFQYCSSSKKAASAAPAKMSFAGNVQPVIQANCSPCHIANQGRAKALNNYEGAKSSVDEIISRINRNPNDKGFMPMRHPKLPDSTIAVFTKWKEDGLME